MMVSLLKGTEFDEFLLHEAMVKMKTDYKFDGFVNKAFDDPEDKEGIEKKENASKYVSWSEIKPIVFELIKGKKTPLSFTISLLLPTEAKNNLLENAGDKEDSIENIDFLLQVKFDRENGGHIITGVSRRSFSLDRSAEREWDGYASKMLTEKGINVEEEQ